MRQRHPRWVGFRIGPFELALWSFLMASAHGAGLMLLPFLVGTGHAAADLGVGAGAADGALAVAVHTAAMVAIGRGGGGARVTRPSGSASCDRPG